MVELARRDVLETLDVLLRAADTGTPGSLRAASYAELATLGREARRVGGAGRRA